MEYSDRVSDYIDRCNTNLRFIENAYQESKDVYEFSQLFCNFISVLIMYKENFKIDSLPISKHGFVCEIIGDDSYDYDFRNNTYWFIQHLRNACCHDGIIINDKNHEIDSVIFIDRKYDDENKNNILAEVKILLYKEQIRKVYEYLLENKENFERKNR